MTSSIRSRWTTMGLSLTLMAGVMLSATPAALAQEGEGEEAPMAQGPAPLISVVTLPVAPPPGAPPPAMEMTIPDSYAEPVGPFTLYMEVIAGAGPSQYGLMAAPGCVVSGVMKRGMKLVWRFEVYDLESGRRLTSADDAQVSVQLADGQSLPARFEARGEPGNVPPDAPWTWVAAWSIPLEQPLGPLDYSVAIATPDGRGALIRPSTWGSLAPQIVD